MRAGEEEAEAEAAREAMRPAEVNFIMSLGIVLVLFVSDRDPFCSMIYNINR